MLASIRSVNFTVCRRAKVQLRARTPQAVRRGRRESREKLTFDTVPDLCGEPEVSKSLEN